MERSTAIAVLCLLFGLLESGISQQNELSPDEILQKASGIANIPELGNLNTSALPSVEDATNLFQKKCEKNGGPTAFENAKRAQEEMGQCLKSLINMEKLNAEMESAKPKGELDEVFKKYCRRSPIFKMCVNNFTTAIEPCLEQEERKSEKIIMNITESLLNFACYKEGDRIALFISSGGPECFQSKQQDIQDCISTTFSSYIPSANATLSAMPGIESLPPLVFNDQECTDMDILQRCVVKKLEKCSDPTPGNIVESIFKYIKKVTPCENLLLHSQTAAVTGVQNNFAVTITPVSIVLALSLSLHRIYHMAFI